MRIDSDRACGGECLRDIVECNDRKHSHDSGNRRQRRLPPPRSRTNPARDDPQWRIARHTSPQVGASSSTRTLIRFHCQARWIRTTPTSSPPSSKRSNARCPCGSRMFQPKWIRASFDDIDLSCSNVPLDYFLNVSLDYDTRRPLSRMYRVPPRCYFHPSGRRSSSSSRRR